MNRRNLNVARKWKAHHYTAASFTVLPRSCRPLDNYVVIQVSIEAVLIARSVCCYWSLIGEVHFGSCHVQDWRPGTRHSRGARRARRAIDQADAARS